MKNEDQLLTDIFAEETNLRQESLKQSLAFMRRRRLRREALRVSIGLGVLLLTAALAIWRQVRTQISETVTVPQSSVAQRIQAEPPTVPGTSIRLVTDEELLNMFPGRAVALMGIGNQRQLVFLDEHRHHRGAPVAN